MLGTRRFKALNGAKGKYSRVVDKIAIYDENGKQIDCCVIHTDEEGREYYYPSNPHEKSGLFSGRPKDAIECIRNGFGDGFEQSHLLGMTLENVVRFLDREYGEEIRQKTIEGWKDIQFACGVKFCFLNSFSDGRLICKDKTLMGYDDTKDIFDYYFIWIVRDIEQLEKKVNQNSFCSVKEATDSIASLKEKIAKKTRKIEEKERIDE